MKRTLELRCHESWVVEAGRHVSPVNYLELQPGPRRAMEKILRTELPWETLQQVRGWSRIRAQLPGLRGGNRLRAPCLFCGQTIARPEEYDHVFNSCAAWGEHRVAVVRAPASKTRPPWHPGTPLRVVLTAAPDEDHFFVAARFASEVDHAASNWVLMQKLHGGQNRPPSGVTTGDS